MKIDESIIQGTWLNDDIISPHSLYTFSMGAMSAFVIIFSASAAPHRFEKVHLTVSHPLWGSTFLTCRKNER